MGTKIKVADFVINHLADLGVKDIFEVYGGANGDLIDAFTRTDKTRYVSVIHEQAGGFAAETYARVSGKPGVAIATSGPGGHNFVTPIANCYYDSVPCLFMTGQVKTEFLRPNASIRQIGFQETDIVKIVEPITKYAKLVTNPQDIRYELEKALFIAQDKRPGPVLLDLPIDVQKATIDLEKIAGFDPTTHQTHYNINKVNGQINTFLTDLSKAKRPVLLVGGGIRIANAIDEVLELGNRLKIPMYPTWNALDVITSDNPYYGGRVGTFGGAGRNFGIQNSDLILAVGSRISGRITGSNLKSFARNAKKYLVDVDEALVLPSLQQIPFDESIFCDAKLFLEQILSKIDTSKVPDFSEWTNKAVGWKNKYDVVSPEMFEENSNNGFVHPYAFMRILSQEMKDGDILVGDCGGNIVIASHAFDTKKDQKFLTNNANSPMGFSFAGAMGAYLASDRNHNVVCTIGDGGFNMNLQELRTVKNYDLKFKTFILNNHCYGITRQFQRTNFEGREEACGPKGYNPPDFKRVCGAYDIKTFNINKNSEVKNVIKDVLKYDGPVVCDVDIGGWDKYTPRVVGWNTPIEDMEPWLPRDEFRQNMIVEPWPGWENHNYAKK